MVKIPPEHDFTQSRTEWELTVFDRAVKTGHFTTSRFLGQGKYDIRKFRRFAAAVNDAGGPDSTGRALVYAVAPTGRFVCVEPILWNELMQRARRLEKSKQGSG